MEVFIVYKTDNWHSFDSRDLIGIGTTLTNAFGICVMKAARENERISKDQKWNLENLKQTQGYSGEGEFFIEPGITDTLL